jgi:germination protein M
MKKILAMLVGIALCMLLGACDSKGITEQEMFVYYLNADKNALRQEAYPKMDAENALKKLEVHGVLTETLKIEQFQREGSNLKLYFETEYYTLAAAEEVLSRAAIVKTLTQVDGVQFVTFYVGEDELTDQSGRPIGVMRAEDFVQNTGSSIDAYQTTDLTLYFADKDGTHLKERKVTGVHYNVNTTIERVVVERLMKGTSASGYQSTIPKTAMLLGVSVKEDICYVNLDSKFVTDSYDIDPELAIYSIVNSVIENSDVTKVQILIDGASDVVYKSSVDLARPLKQNVQLLQEEK